MDTARRLFITSCLKSSKDNIESVHATNRPGTHNLTSRRSRDSTIKLERKMQVFTSPEVAGSGEMLNWECSGASMSTLLRTFQALGHSECSRWSRYTAHLISLTMHNESLDNVDSITVEVLEELGSLTSLPRHYADGPYGSLKWQCIWIPHNRVQHRKDKQRQGEID